MAFDPHHLISNNVFVLLFPNLRGSFVLNIMYWLPIINKCRFRSLFFLLSHWTHAPFHLPSPQTLQRLFTFPFIHILFNILRNCQTVKTVNLILKPIGIVWKFAFLRLFDHPVDGDCIHEIKRSYFLGRKAMSNLDSTLKSKEITADKGPYSQSCAFSSSNGLLWELYHKKAEW